MSSSLLLFVVFSNVSHYSLIMQILCHLVLVCPLKTIINSFSHIPFSQLTWDILSRDKESIISCLLISFTHQVEFFLLVLFNILTLHLFNFK